MSVSIKSAWTIPFVLLVCFVAGVAGGGKKETPAQLVAANDNAAPSPKPSPAPTGQARASVKQSRAEFWFRVASADAEREWATSPDNQLEYAWVVVLPCKSSIYEVRFSLFKFPGEPRHKGSLEGLLAAGQADVWETAPGGSAKVMEGVRGIRVYRKDDGVMVELTDADILKKLREVKPKELTFETRGVLLQKHRQTVAVAYE